MNKRRIVRTKKENIAFELKQIEKILGSDYNLNYIKTLIENDRNKKLLILPVSIGDTLYLVNKHDKTSGNILEVKVTGVHLKDEKGFRGVKREEYLIVRSCYGYSMHVNLNKIGKTAFVDYNEARYKLKELQNLE